jgi:hypothetical protein
MISEVSDLSHSDTETFTSYFKKSMLFFHLVTPCSNDPCLSNGVCSISGSSYTCACDSGYSGTNCEGIVHIDDMKIERN